MKYRKISGLWVGGGVECLGSNRTEWNKKIGEKERKNSNIITVPPTNGPCPHGLTVCPPLPGWLLLSGRRVSSGQSIRVFVIEIFLQIEIVIVLSQDSGPIIRIDAVHVFPGIMFLQKSIPSYLELETILEPLSINILLHNPEILIIDLNRRRRWLPMSWNHVRLCF